MLGIMNKKYPFFWYEHQRYDNVALIHMPVWGVEAPPIGLGYISSSLNAHDIHPLILDLNIIAFNSLAGYTHLWEESNQYLWLHEQYYRETIQPLLDPLYEKALQLFHAQRIRVFGFSLSPFHWHASIDLMRKIKEHNEQAIIIGGGPLWREKQDIPQEGIMTELLDGYILKEGEKTFYAVYEGFIKTGSVSGPVPGFYDCKQKTYTPYTLIKNLDDIPFPTYKGFQLSDYTGKIINLTTSRGCVGQCTFCGDRLVFPGYRCASAERMLAEVRYHVNEYGIQRFVFNDLAINCHHKRLETFCDLMIAHTLSVEWYCLVLLKHELPLETLYKMRAAGCISMTVGLESASNKVLSLMNKQTTIETVQIFLQHAQQAGLKVNVHIIVGYPGEEEEDFMKTYHFVKDYAAYINEVISVNICDICSTAALKKQALAVGVQYPPESQYWFMKGNTIRVRRERLTRLLSLIRAQNIRLLGSNIHQMESPLRIGEEVSRHSAYTVEQFYNIAEKRNLLETIHPDSGVSFLHGKNISLQGMLLPGQKFSMRYYPLDDCFEEMWGFGEMKAVYHDWTSYQCLIVHITADGRGGVLQVIIISENGSHWRFMDTRVLDHKGSWWVEMPFDRFTYGAWSPGPPEKDMSHVVAWNIGINSIPENPAESQTLTVHGVYCCTISESSMPVLPLAR